MMRFVKKRYRISLLILFPSLVMLHELVTERYRDSIDCSGVRIVRSVTFWVHCGSD